MPFLFGLGLGSTIRKSLIVRYGMMVINTCHQQLNAGHI